MTAGNTKTPRLLAAAKEFNIGKETLLEFLKGKGFELENKPTSKLTEDMYDSLHKAFAKDKATKQKSDEIALPKGATFLESLNKSEAELDLAARDKPAEKVAKPVKTTAPKAAAKAEEPVLDVPVEKTEPKKEESKEVSTPKVEEAPVIVIAEPKAEPQPIVETPKDKKIEEKQTAEKPELKKEEIQEAKKVAIVEKTPTDVQSAAADNKEPEHIDLSSPKLQGPKIINKIDLDNINMQTRPKKGQVTTQPNNNKDNKKGTPNAPKFNDPKKVHPKPEAKKEHKTPERKEQPRVASRPTEEPKLAHQKLITEVTFEAQPVEEAREHIETNAPKLEGPKILGKIELPTGTVGGRQERKDKRKRKRIPLDKKPETNKPATGGSFNAGDNRNNNNRPNQGNNNRPGGNNQQGGNRPGYQGNRPNNGGPGGNRNNSGPGNRNNFNPNNKFGKPGQAQQPQEVDAKEI